MSPQSRSLVVIAVMAILGVGALGFLAQRYGKIARSQGPAVEAALLRVDEFIRVRRAMHLEIETVGEPAGEAVRSVRDRAMAVSGISLERYEEMRGIYRSWLEGELEGPSPIFSALERRRAELEQLDLGPYESLDS